MREGVSGMLLKPFQAALAIILWIFAIVIGIIINVMFISV